jgi:hypothetical protein
MRPKQQEEKTSLADLLRKNREKNKTNLSSAEILSQLKGLPANQASLPKASSKQKPATSLVDYKSDLETYGLRLDPLVEVFISPGLKAVSGQDAVSWFMRQSLEDPMGYRQFNVLLEQAGFSGSTPEARFIQAVAYAQQTGRDVFEVTTLRALEGYGVKEEKGPKVNVGNILRAIQRSAVQRGIKLTNQQEKTLLNQAISQEWDSATLQENIARVGAVGETGESAQIIDNLRQFATAYGVEYNPAWYENAARLVLGGKTTVDQFQNEIKNISKTKYLNYTDLIDQGMSPTDIASPYMQVMANTLDLDPTLVSLTNPVIENALTRIGEDGKPRPMGLQEFKTMLKTDRSLGYSKTKQGQEDYLSTGLQFLGDLTGGVYRG